MIFFDEGEAGTTGGGTAQTSLGLLMGAVFRNASRLTKKNAHTTTPVPAMQANKGAWARSVPESFSRKVSSKTLRAIFA